MFNQGMDVGHAFEMIGQALGLRREPFQVLLASDSVTRLGFLVLVLAGFSEALGQSIVLFVNRVKPRRFVASLLLSTLIFAFGFGFWSFSIWVVADVLFEVHQPFRVVPQVLSLAYAPYLFSFFTLTPYFGTFFGSILSLWRLLAVLIAVSVSLSLTLSQALICGALGWMLLQVLQRTIGRPVVWLSRRLRRMVAGVPLVFDKNRWAELVNENVEDDA